MKISQVSFFNFNGQQKNNKQNVSTPNLKPLAKDTFTPSFGRIPFSPKWGITEEFYQLVDNIAVSKLPDFIKVLEKEGETLKGAQKSLKEAQIKFAKAVKKDYDDILSIPDSKMDNYNPMDYLIDGNDY